MPPTTTVFSSFSTPVQKAIQEKGFAVPTEPQIKAIPPIMAGKNVLLIAPTATGKTESALLPVFDALIKTERAPGIKVLYITPLKALNRDMLERLQWWCKRLDLRLGVRHSITFSAVVNTQTWKAALYPIWLFLTCDYLNSMVIKCSLR